MYDEPVAGSPLTCEYRITVGGEDFAYCNSFNTAFMIMEALAAESKNAESICWGRSLDSSVSIGWTRLL